jgi:YD repeat-containing protein
MNKHVLLLPILLLSAALFSCKKNKSAQQCSLTSIKDSTTTVEATTQFTYDQQNRLTEALVTGVKGCKRTYQYIGNKVIFVITDTTPGILTERDTLSINANGLIETQSAYFPTSATSSVETYVYDDAGIALSSTEKVNGLPGDTLLYTTTAGDLMFETVKGQSIHKTDFAYSAQSIVYGDPTDFRQLLYYGAYYYKNKHMLTTLASPGRSYRIYSYTFNDNRITQVLSRQWSSASADTIAHTLTYSYSCK